MSAVPDDLGFEPNPGTRFYGKYRARVSDNQDPSNLGRIQAKVPEILGDVVTGWALFVLPYSGDGVGVYTIPAIDAGVWVEFEAGDVSRPIWTGCWWGNGQLPKDETGASTTPDKKIVRTEQGLLLSFDDGGKTITLSDSNGSNLLKIETQPGKLKLLAASKVVVEAPQIELVENATHPLVFGDDLLTYLQQVVQMFNAHMHPGQMAAGVLPVTPAPPVPMLTPPTPALLSVKVKTG